jgi:hypothetical protein
MVAVEVLDPVTQLRVTRGLAVSAKGLDGDPLLSWSGRFVWVDQVQWPEEISVVPVGLPFANETVVPERPPRFPEATAEQRRVRVVLRPTAAYPFSTGVTAIRGLLCERIDQDPIVPVENARVQVAWREVRTGKWIPAPTTPVQAPSTDSKGQFGVFLRLPTLPPQMPDLEKGLLKVRLQFTRDGTTRATPEDFSFLANPAPKGRVTEGAFLTRDLKLGWVDLAAI